MRSPKKGLVCFHDCTKAKVGIQKDGTRHRLENVGQNTWHMDAHCFSLDLSFGDGFHLSQEKLKK